MIRATTPTHTFTFKNLNPETFKVLNVYYAQQGVELLCKSKEDFTFKTKEVEDGIVYEAAVTLSQEETKMFKAKYDVEVQVRALTADDRSLASPKTKLSVWDVINDEVLE